MKFVTGANTHLRSGPAQADSSSYTHTHTQGGSSEKQTKREWKEKWIQSGLVLFRSKETETFGDLRVGTAVNGVDLIASIGQGFSHVIQITARVARGSHDFERGHRHCTDLSEEILCVCTARANAVGGPFVLLERNGEEQVDTG